MTSPSEAQDRKTYQEVREALAEGRELNRDFRTGELVPPSLSGKLFSASDLHASAFARIDAAFERANRKVAQQPLKHAAE